MEAARETACSCVSAKSFRPLSWTAPGGKRSESVTIIRRRALIFWAPDQPATAQPVLWRCSDSLDQGRAQHRGREKVAAAGRMAERFSKKSPPRSCPAELRPAKTRAAAKKAGSSAVCQRVAASLRAAVVKKPGTEPRCLQAPWEVAATR